MFDQVLENLRKATESTVQMQHEMFRKWAGLWPGMPVTQPVWGEPVQKFQKKWAETVAALVKKQNESLETQFKAGLQSLEAAFRVAEAKDAEELRVKTLELWQKSFECLRQVYEAQTRDFQEAMTKWTELMMKGVA
jgi:hypothetical protein